MALHGLCTYEVAALQCRAAERGVLALTSGRAEYAGTGEE